MEKYYEICVRGKTREYCFLTKGHLEYLQEWRDEGLDIVEVVNVIPQWINDLGLTKIWCFIQDLGFLKP